MKMIYGRRACTGMILLTALGFVASQSLESKVCTAADASAPQVASKRSNTARRGSSRRFRQWTSNANAAIEAGDWPQWGGTRFRNNTPVGTNIPMTWNVGRFDRKTGNWLRDEAENIKWVSRLGSQSYGNPVISAGQVYVGTNNGAGHLKRYPSEIDLGCLLAFRESDGQFLWQHSSEKLPTGRVHDWPFQGICSTPLVEGDRLWFVSSRGHVICLDTAGFHDGEDDGPVVNELGRLFDLNRNDDPAKDEVAPAVAALNKGQINESLRTNFARRGAELPLQAQVETVEAGKRWMVKARIGESDRQLTITLEGPRLSAYKVLSSADKDEADTVWSYDMMKLQGISQHNMCSCSVTTLGDILFVITSNGVDESHINIPAQQAPSFMAMNKTTGEVYWTDNSPGLNIVHGQWSSPSVAVLGGVPQVLFGGGDGYLYSFRRGQGQGWQAGTALEVRLQSQGIEMGARRRRYAERHHRHSRHLRRARLSRGGTGSRA